MSSFRGGWLRARYSLKTYENKKRKKKAGGHFVSLVEGTAPQPIGFKGNTKNPIGDFGAVLCYNASRFEEAEEEEEEEELFLEFSRSNLQGFVLQLQLEVDGSSEAAPLYCYLLPGDCVSGPCCSLLTC